MRQEEINKKDHIKVLKIWNKRLSTTEKFDLKNFRFMGKKFHISRIGRPIFTDGGDCISYYYSLIKSERGNNVDVEVTKIRIR